MTIIAAKINIDNKCDHISLINDIAVNKFNAKSAHEVNTNVFNIDDGLNDVRAYFDVSNRGITFICRYAKDIPSVKQRIEEFVANSASIKITL